MRVAKQARLPTAEAVVADRHRHGHIDADHADLHIELELSRRATVAREDRGAVTELVVVDQRETLVVALDASDGEDWPEDLFVVTAHAGLRVVDQARLQEEAIGGQVAGDCAVDHDSRALATRTVDVALHLVAMLAGDQRAHLAAVLTGRTNDDRGQPVFDLGDEIVCNGIARKDD